GNMEENGANENEPSLQLRLLLRQLVAAAPDQLSHKTAGLPAAIHALGGAGLRYDDLCQLRQPRFQPPPNPGSHIFARRIIQTRNLVQVMMVKLFPEGFEGLRNLGVIHEPAELGIAFPGDHNLRLEAVAMEPPAFVRL